VDRRLGKLATPAQLVGLDDPHIDVLDAGVNEGAIAAVGAREGGSADEEHR
jgi:hypothetical protein